MEIQKGVAIHDLALFLKKSGILVLGDLHIGQEASMQREGFLIPRFQHKDLVTKTKRILEETKPKLIILNGDVKHEFSGISREEWKHVLDYLDLLQKYAKVIIIKGNHDTIIDPIAMKKGIKVIDYYTDEGTYICHGDVIPGENVAKKSPKKKPLTEEPERALPEGLKKGSKGHEDFKKAKTIIIGHEHPAICLWDNNRSEKYKCFLKGKYKNKTLIVMPSMNQLTEGTDVLTEKLLSPFLHQNLNDFDTWIVENEIYHFGKLRGLRKE